MTIAESPINELLFACRKLRLDYRANPDNPGGPWRAQCPVCRTTSMPDELPLTITGTGHLRCAHRCDPEQIAKALSQIGDAPETEAAPVMKAAWLTGTPMDPAASPTETLPGLPGFQFILAGTGSVIVGPTGGGRSSLAQVGLYDGAKAGLRGSYLGSEVTEPEFNARAAILAGLRGDTIDDELRQQLAGVRYLNLASVISQAWEHPELWVSGMRAAYEIVVIDPLSAVASALDLDFDRSNAEFLRFYDKLVQPLTTAGVAVVLIDNVGHATDARTRAKGASAKSDRADLTFSCALVTGPVGLVIKAQKVRTVRAEFQRGDEWLFDRDTQRIQNRETAGDGDEPTFRPTTLMERVSRFVEKDPGVGKKAIRTGVQGRGTYIDQALTILIDEDYIVRREEDQTHRHYSVNAFKADATVPSRVPDRVPPTVSPVSPVSQRVSMPCPPAQDDRVPRAIRAKPYGHGDVVNNTSPNPDHEPEPAQPESGPHHEAD